MPKLPRTIRLDPSDTFVFERAAEPGEWAVTGSFLFLDQDVTALAGKARAADEQLYRVKQEGGNSVFVDLPDREEES